MKGMFQRSKYFDWAATTFLTQNVQQALHDYVDDISLQGNPGSPHLFGREAAALLRHCREIFARAFHVEPEQVVFTSGGTEANNLAIQGFVKSTEHTCIPAPWFLVSPTAHHSMYETVLSYTLTIENVQSIGISEGVLDLDSCSDWFKWRGGRPSMIAVEGVNNETGVRHPVEKIIAKADYEGVPILVDAVQMLPHDPFGTFELQADWISISSHKIGGPKGVGALIVRNTSKLSPLMIGGDQEEKFRPGTQNILGILGFTQAFRDLYEHPETSLFLDEYCLERDSWVKGLINFYGFQTSVPLKNCVKGFYNLYLPCESAYVVSRLSEDGYCVSTGAACSGAEERSHVLEHMMLEGNRGLRIVTSQFNGPNEISELLEKINDIVKEVNV